MKEDGNVVFRCVEAYSSLSCCVCKLVSTPWQEDNGYVPLLANPETSVCEYTITFTDVHQ